MTRSPTSPDPAQGPAGCPRSSGRGQPVELVTLEALLTPDARQRLSPGPWSFCADPTCDVVYFDAQGQTYSRGELTVRVGVKESASPRPLCYCFGHSIESIEEELARTGASTAVSVVAAEVKARNCRCEVTNPSGTCCLPELRRAERSAPGRVQSRLARQLQPERWAVGGSIFAALVASACCWLPLALVGLGASTASFSAKFEPWRPAFGAATFILLGLAFWLTYRTRPVGAKGLTDDCCATAPAAGPPSRSGRANRLLLWLATPLALGFVFFPNLYEGIAGGPPMSGTLEAGEPAFMLTIEGMTCSACSVTLSRSLRAIPGVSDALVDHESGQARVYVQNGTDVPVPVIAAAVDQAGFQTVSIE